MNLATAQQYATQILAWLKPFCERIEIAGSVRRQRPICNDIDLVVIPKFSAPSTDLFGSAAGARTNHLHAMLVNYVHDARQSACAHPDAETLPRWQSGETNPEGANFILQLPRCQLDIYVATQANWGSKLLQRTGSKEHNIWLASRAQRHGCRWELDRGIVEIGSADHIGTCVGAREEDIYGFLNLRFIPPANREPGQLDQFVNRTMKPI